MFKTSRDRLCIKIFTILMNELILNIILKKKLKMFNESDNREKVMFNTL